jgi:hypothetical protein
MISLSLTIRNAFYPKSNFKHLFYWSKSIFTHKAVEVEFCRYNYFWLTLSVETYFRGGDHAGPGLEIGLFGYSLSLKMHDTRHWDYETQTWEKYDET